MIDIHINPSFAELMLDEGFQKLVIGNVYTRKSKPKHFDIPFFDGECGSLSEGAERLGVSVLINRINILKLA